MKGDFIMKRLTIPSMLLVIASLMPQVHASPTKAFVDEPLRDVLGDVSVLMHVAPSSDLASAIARAKKAGFFVGSIYESIDVFVAYGPGPALINLSITGTFEAFEANRVVQTFTDNSHKATRGQDLLNGVVTLPDGTVIDGSGVGVAVVDSGLDGTHPDLADHVGSNVKVVCTTPQFVTTSLTGFTTCTGPKTIVPLEDTDTPSLGGHGTHVSGIIAGDGSASAGKYHGAAPGATLYGISVGTTITVENGLDGLEWVLENHDQVTPAIKVVNNSWGSSGHNDYGTGPFHSATWQLQEALIAEGVTVVFAAGNAGGNGSAATTSSECTNPTPGLICVANYDDNNTGSRAGSISSTSSRGLTTDPRTWPDIAAPGTAIKSTCRDTLPICIYGGGKTENNLYGNMSGTSMAAPHITGIVAQILQVDPTLTPAEVEDILEDTAHKFVWGAAYTMNDPFNTDDPSSFEKGHGLVDVRAAAEYLLDPCRDGEETMPDGSPCPI